MKINLSNSYLKKFKELNIAIIYLFGSFAEDKALPLSDIDIGILLTQESVADPDIDIGEIYNRVYDILTDIFPSKYLDIVFLHKAPLDLRVVLNPSFSSRGTPELKGEKEWSFCFPLKIRGTEGSYEIVTPLAPLNLRGVTQEFIK